MTAGQVTAHPKAPPVVLATIATAWLLVAAVRVSGNAGVLNHDALIEGHVPLVLAFALFAAAWQAMIAAMMLPSTLPLVGLFAVASARAPRSRRATWALLGGYSLVWTVFGLLAFSGDIAVHRTVDSVPWLAQHAWLIAGGTLATASVYQFSPLKGRCLRKCRHPAGYLTRHYQPGSAAAFALGSRNGLSCLGCCWALMLVMFGAGVADLWWMAALTALMVYEKSAPRGQRATPIAGGILLVYAALVLAHPAWLPPAFSGGL